MVAKDPRLLVGRVGSRSLIGREGLRFLIDRWSFDHFNNLTLSFFLMSIFFLTFANFSLLNELSRRSKSKRVEKHRVAIGLLIAFSLGRSNRDYLYCKQMAFSLFFFCSFVLLIERGNILVEPGKERESHLHFVLIE